MSDFMRAEVFSPAIREVSEVSTQNWVEAVSAHLVEHSNVMASIAQDVFGDNSSMQARNFRGTLAEIVVARRGGHGDDQELMERLWDDASSLLVDRGYSLGGVDPTGITGVVFEGNLPWQVEERLVFNTIEALSRVAEVRHMQNDQEELVYSLFAPSQRDRLAVESGITREHGFRLWGAARANNVSVSDIFDQWSEVSDTPYRSVRVALDKATNNWSEYMERDRFTEGARAAMGAMLSMEALSLEQRVAVLRSDSFLGKTIQRMDGRLRKHFLPWVEALAVVGAAYDVADLQAQLFAGWKGMVSRTAIHAADVMSAPGKSPKPPRPPRRGDVVKRLGLVAIVLAPLIVSCTADRDEGNDGVSDGDTQSTSVPTVEATKLPPATVAATIAATSTHSLETPEVGASPTPIVPATSIAEARYPTDADSINLIAFERIDGASRNDQISFLHLRIAPNIENVQGSAFDDALTSLDEIYAQHGGLDHRLTGINVDDQTWVYIPANADYTKVQVAVVATEEGYLTLDPALQPLNPNSEVVGLREFAIPEALQEQGYQFDLADNGEFTVLVIIDDKGKVAAWLDASYFDSENDKQGRWLDLQGEEIDMQQLAFELVPPTVEPTETATPVVLTPGEIVATNAVFPDRLVIADSEQVSSSSFVLQYSEGYVSRLGVNSVTVEDDMPRGWGEVFQGLFEAHAKEDGSVTLAGQRNGERFVGGQIRGEVESLHIMAVTGNEFESIYEAMQGLSKPEGSYDAWAWLDDPVSKQPGLIAYFDGNVLYVVARMGEVQESMVMNAVAPIAHARVSLELLLAYTSGFREDVWRVAGCAVVEKDGRRQLSCDNSPIVVE